MDAHHLIAVKNSVRELVRRRPGYRSIGVVRDDGDALVLIDISPNADLKNYKDVIGDRDGVKVRVRRVEGTIRADALRSG